MNKGSTKKSFYQVITIIGSTSDPGGGGNTKTTTFPLKREMFRGEGA